MIEIEEFRLKAHEFVDWITDYFSNVDKLSVRSQILPGEIKKNIPWQAPENSETIENIFNDFKNLLLPGITHWQSPKFFAYFPSNNSYPSVLAEFLTAALGVQGMKWITSPAATELEEVIIGWLRSMIGLPETFSGVILDTASVANLTAILCAREKVTQLSSNEEGLFLEKEIRIYCSSEAHSSVEKAVRIAGLGSKNLCKIEVDDFCRMIPARLSEAIAEDRKRGYSQACIVAALGTTGTCAIDPIAEIATIAQEYGIWLHIDAAFAGTALILPEIRESIKGIEHADSFVFNPHKWMFTNFDCSAFFIRDPAHLQNTFRLVPSYLQTNTNTEVNDYSNWGIHLGRRFRALKLWFVIRSFGIEGLQKKIREHLKLALYFEEFIIKSDQFELVVPASLSVISFRLNPGSSYTDEQLNKLNSKLLEKVNDSGHIFISHTLVREKYTLRLVCAQTNTQKVHIDEAIETLKKCAIDLMNNENL